MLNPKDILISTEENRPARVVEVTGKLSVTEQSQVSEMELTYLGERRDQFLKLCLEKIGRVIWNRVYGEIREDLLELLHTSASHDGGPATDRARLREGILAAIDKLQFPA